ncbi:hypothetical protein E2562_019088 [Oryza meyeriana var. granulata]|uniref:SKI-interacting protein SKIP SNW domain-containing protein n=1 Tax=Oryza meyeriana var. granulata TaxID=110450 RepID=A0A6G1CQ70_9ORYZ|nr:hypothetical protein E2562_019088 [Oryza meyeriana var. granulata]
MVLRLPAPTGGEGGAPGTHDHTEDNWFKERYAAGGGDEPKSWLRSVNLVPPYGRRSALAPRRKEDFGDGGAFPEVHVAQYPLDMGRRVDGDGERRGSSDVLNLTVDGSGRVEFDAVVKQGENARKTVYSSPGDVVPKINAAANEDDDEDVEETTARTSAALRAIVEKRLSAVQPANIQASNHDRKLIKYTPAAPQSSAFNSGAAERIIRMEEMQQDPLEPTKFKHKRVPAPAGSPPVPVLRSPPWPLSQKDHDDWKVPPNISNWKNPQGYSIPLDKRAALDGRSLQDVQISHAFAALAEALYVAEQKAREAVQARSNVQTELRMKEQEQKEQRLRQVAKNARAEMLEAAAAAGKGETPSEQSKVAERDAIREARRRERERERRAAAAASKKSEATRDNDRDVSERIALGMASTGRGGAGGEVTYDQRLFNQDRGMDSGFASDDQYNVYSGSGRLFAALPALSTLYKPSNQGDSDIYGDADEHLEKIAKTYRFKPDRGFSGDPESVAGKRERPAEFDQPEREEEEDPFHLDQFLARIKKGKQQ